MSQRAWNKLIAVFCFGPITLTRIPWGILLFAPSVLAQPLPQPLLVGEAVEIDSRVLNEPRTIFIATPSSYDQSNQRYGVVYVLDAEWQFRHAVTSAEFLGGFANQVIPPLLIVGIRNTDRMRDLTPVSQTPENALLPQGGADDFLEFVATELAPWIDERYRTTDYRVLAGHSLGGLFAVHALISQPDAFDGYLVIDPSLNWNAQETVQHATEVLAEFRLADASLYLAVSDFDGTASAGTRSFVETLTASAPNGLRWELERFPDESHDSLPLPAIFQGLRWIFGGWDVSDQAAALFSDAPAEEIFESLDEIYGQSGLQFGMDRETPYLMFESLLAHLAENDRVDEAAELTLRHADRFPLPLVPNVISGIARLFVDGGDPAAATAYLNAVLDIYPGNETAMQALTAMGADSRAE